MRFAQTRSEFHLPFLGYPLSATGEADVVAAVKLEVLEVLHIADYPVARQSMTGQRTGRYSIWNPGPFV